jgi:hypothetical protein
MCFRSDSITTADQAQAICTKPYKFYIKLLNGKNLTGQVTRLMLQLFLTTPAE